MTEEMRRSIEEDALGRRAAQCEFNRPVVLEAGAGTGKTTTLVARILGWCLGPGWDDAAETVESARADAPRTPGEVDSAGSGDFPGEDRVAIEVLQGLVALTFTEAAAAEMAQRVAQALALVATGREDKVTGLDLGLLPSPPAPTQRVERAVSLLGNLDHLTATTIHSYCLGLLLQHPLEAGVHPNLKIDAEAALVEETVHEVLEDRLTEAWSAQQPNDPLIGLLNLGVAPAQIADAALALLKSGVPSGALGEDPLGDGVETFVNDLEAALAAALEQMLPEFATLPAGSVAARVAHASEATSELLRSSELSGAAALTALRDHALETWPDNLLTRLGDWAQGEFITQETKVIRDTAAVKLAGARLRPLIRHARKLDPELLDLGRRALAPLARTVEISLRSRGIATFPFLLAAARDLLAENESLQRRLRLRMRQLLVDEFQDTDGLQCDIVRYLALEGAPEERPGLFLVGDPKQSIFGWRSADLAAYDSFKAAAVAGGGTVHALHRNFRSVSPVLDEVESAIEPVMEAEEAVQPPFARLLVSDQLSGDPGYSDDTRRPIEYWVSWAADAESPTTPAKSTLVDVGSRLEAEAVADDIRRIHDLDDDVSWSDFGLIFRASGRIETYLTALREAGVPFVVAKDKHYYRRREVIEAAAVLRAVVNPADHLALLTFLRSPAAGLPDAALLPLWRGAFPARMTSLEGPGERLEEIADQLRDVAASLPTDVPGLDRIAGWEESVIAAVRALAALRRAFTSEPADLFLDRARRLVLLEATESARYLGPYRLANLDRFFRGVEAEMRERSGNVRAILRAIQRNVQEAREEDEARPKESAEDAVRVMTIHGAKGLEFEHVYLVAVDHGRGGGAPPDDFDERWAPGEPAEYRIFKAPTPGFHRLEVRREQVAAAEQVRTLYVALTRACRRLVVAGIWSRKRKSPHWSNADTHARLLESRTGLPASLEDLWSQCVDANASSIVVEGVRWVFPALATAGETPGPASTPDDRSPLATDAMERRIVELEAQREGARQRNRRPFAGTPSHHEPRSFDDEAEENRESERDDEGAVGRRAALAAGTALHAMLETWDTSVEVAVEAERVRARLHLSLEPGLDAEVERAATKRLERLLERLSRGDLIRRLVSLEPHVVARELPMVLAPGEDDAATGYISGLIDLLYRDPDTGRLTIADFKTDRVETEEAIEELRTKYRPQMELYRRAVARFYSGEEPPDCELWALWPDRILKL